MKKVVIGFFIFLAVLLSAAALVPVLFKDKIKQALDKEIAKNINAKVVYETDDVSLSLFRDFPNISLGIDNLVIIGQDSFATDTLAKIPSFHMGLNLMSVISGDELKVNSISLEEPVIKLIVLESGLANWDIFIPDTTAAVATDTAASDFSMAIKEWTVNDGTLFYSDLSIPFGLVGYNVDHTGSGDFEQNVFDMTSQTVAERFTVTYDGVNYIENADLNADVTMAMDFDKYLYTFKENNIRLNAFPFKFDGTILMPEEDIDLNLTFEATETDFKNVLSVVPGMYSEKFDELKTEGKLSFNGYIKGRYNETTMPGFGTDLKIVDGMFKYPDLPQAARNINVDMSVKNKDGIVNNTSINVRQLHMELGKNPIDARVLIEGLEPMKINGNVLANLDLDEITKVFPIEGMDLKGLLKVDADAKGIYSETSMPVIEADLRLTNGYVKSKDFPAPIQELNMVTNVLNTTGDTDDTRINVERFNMILDGEPLEGRALVVGIDKPAFDFDVKGILDLTKLTKIFPQEGMNLAGQIKANVSAKGKMSDIETEKYNNITANGTMAISNLVFESEELPQGIKVNSANAVFNNEQILLKDVRGFLGKSDIVANGVISNYLGYALAEDQALRGNISINSNMFNINEWMVEETTGEAIATADPGATGVVQVPDNLDMTLNVDAKNILYDNLELENVTGRVKVKNEVAMLEQVKFKTLGGTFATSGSYNTQNLQKPLFDLNLDVENLQFKEAFRAFNTIRVLAPIAALLEGTFSTKFNFAGVVGEDMMPVFQTLDGRGVINVIKAAVSDVPIMEKISNLTNLREISDLVVENRYIDAQFIDGSLVIRPFDVKVGDIAMTVGGTNHVNGEIDYVTALSVPTGKIGQQVSSKLASMIGGNQLQAAERVTLKLNIGGTFKDPRVALAGGSVKEQAANLVKEVVQDKLDVVQQKLDQRKAQAQDSIKAELNRQKLAAEQKAREELEKKRKEAEEQLRKKAADKIGDFLKPKPKPAPVKPDTTKAGSN